MKIQLEQRLRACPEQVGCCICAQNFTPPSIRALVCNDAGLIQGDICTHCLKLKAHGIKRKMQARSGLLLQQAEVDTARSLALRQQAFELLLLSQEPLTLPSFYTWLRKRWEILSLETQALEAARFGGKNACACGKPSGLRIVFEDDASH